MNALKIGVAVILTAAIVAALIYRYQEYWMYREIQSFFGQTATLLPFSAEGIPNAPAPDVPEPLPEHGNLIDHLIRNTTQNPNRSAVTGLIVAGYGTIDEFTPTPRWPSQTEGPVWFLLRPRPGLAAYAIRHQTTEDGWLYFVEAQPYDVSNGLWSEGFLYVDELGRRAGYYDSFYPLRR